MPIQSTTQLRDHTGRPFEVKKAKALVYKGESTAGLEDIPLAELDEGKLHLKALYSGISRGTESLVYAGLVPQSEWERMRVPYQIGDFAYPTTYGYSMIARVENADSELAGRSCFLLHPHQCEMVVDADSITPLPDNIPSRRAVLAANMETALNAFWDAAPQAGQKICIIGGGVVGFLILHVLQRKGFNVTAVIDPDKDREKLSSTFNTPLVHPDKLTDQRFDLIFHTSGSPRGLQTAIDHAAFEGKIIELSWYGNKQASLKLGGAFHSQRLTIQSSQVGHVAPSKRPEVSYKQRLAEAISLLDDDRLDNLLEDDCPFDDLPSALPTLLNAPGKLCQVVKY